MVKLYSLSSQYLHCTQSSDLLRSGLHFAKGAVGRSVVSGESLELQRVKRVLSASDVLHSVFPPTALAEETGGGGDRGERGRSQAEWEQKEKKKKAEMVTCAHDEKKRWKWSFKHECKGLRVLLEDTRLFIWSQRETLVDGLKFWDNLNFVNL